jgi:photosystem II stability/assembly factor-like uncharacterized protein
MGKRLGFLFFGAIFLVILSFGHVGESVASSTQAASSSEGVKAVLFSDDFEKGIIGKWELKPGWEIELEDGNHVLSGKGHTWAKALRSEGWGVITSFETRIKRIDGGAHINFRLSKKGARYFVAVYENRLSLKKSILKDPAPTEGDPFNHVELTEVNLRLGPTWHTIKITGNGTNLKVYIDGQLKIDYNDEQDPYLYGSVAFETLRNSHFYFDDVIVMGEAPPEPPPGYVWKKLGGPRGGIGYDVRIHPHNQDIVYVTDAWAGVHKSVDGGETWEAINRGIISRTGPSGDAIPVFSLTIDQNSPNIIWMGTQGMKGVYKSTDGGENWVKMDNGIEDQPGMEIRSFTVDPTNSDVVYLGGNYPPDPTKSNVVKGFIYKTTDGGKNWFKILDSGALFRWIIVDPTNPDIIYASTGIFDRVAVEPEGIFKSTDGGKTWFHINNGLTSLAVPALAMHPEDSNVLFATTGKATDFLNDPKELKGEVFKTTDGGNTWKSVYSKPGRDQLTVSAVAFSPSNPDVVYVDTGSGIFLKSTDGGETWREYRNGPPGEWAGTAIGIAVHPTNPDIIFIDAYDGGVFKSADGGKSWKDASKGYTGAQVWDIAIDADNPSYVVAASKTQVYKSLNGGEDWIGLHTKETGPSRYEGPPNNALSVALNPYDNREMLVGSQLRGYIVKTKDGGGSWYYVLPPLSKSRTFEDRESVYDIAYSPSNPSIVFAATGVSDFVFSYKSMQGHGVFKSTDSGGSWNPINRGLEDTTLSILSVAVHPNNPDIVYIGTLNSGVYKSTDGGNSWFKSSSGLSNSEIRSLAIDPNNPDIIYAGAEFGGVFKSTDVGASWKPVIRGMDFEASIRAIAIDPTNSQVIYAADRRTGVYRSDDGGENWVKINEGLETRAVNALAISSDGKVIYAATEGEGVFQLGEVQPEVVATPTTLPPTQPPTTTTSTAATEKIGSVLPYLGVALLLLGLIGWGLWRRRSRRKAAK